MKDENNIIACLSMLRRYLLHVQKSLTEVICVEGNLVGLFSLVTSVVVT